LNTYKFDCNDVTSSRRIIAADYDQRVTRSPVQYFEITATLKTILPFLIEDLPPANVCIYLPLCDPPFASVTLTLNRWPW